ncbi:trimethylamine methyltransferase family protein [Microbaculum marinisediminis]|uniref:Methyltransferase n=1 Tax=Microbaculum marinisediminis TaxID=2931392 RepID=A0AAW5QSZ0_9HYPH|nr:trimethylamine methyltransferase family protein [Microbaculum sp. A6E488]MCT8971156.1 trimethylamine methyltransferase family protein [Microbaculum sp. A6E488]
MDTGILTDGPERSHRRTGRSRRAGQSRGLEQKPFRQPRMTYRPIEIISADALEDIHNASLTILEEIGIDFMHEEAKAVLKRAGADVEPGSDRVRIDRGLIMQALTTCPPEFTMHARNPAHNVRFGGDWIAFAQMASAPNCSDMDGGRRPGNQQDFRSLVKLAQSFNIIHLTGGYPVEPVDLHASIRHLECLRDFATLTDKVFHVYSLGKERNRDGIEIARIARGVTDEQLERQPSVLSIINSSSPLRLDTPMLQGIIEMSSRNQVIVVTPFTLAGAMAPVTLAGALAQQNAEALAGIAFTQLVRPGAPVVYGGFTSNVDMKSGAPAFGTPEYMKAANVGGQLARRYNLPYRTSNTCAANTLDAQAAYESVFSLWGAIMGGGNLIKHAAGWMEGGLTVSYEKIILDVDLLQMVAEYLEPIVVDTDTLALDAIRDVGPGGHFFGTPHTQARYRDAFYAPLLSDWRNYETWSEAGGPTAYEKAHRLWQEALAQYEPPPLDPAIAEEIDAFVARRIAEGGAPTDF